MENQNTNPFEPVNPEQNKANMPELGATPGSKKNGKLIAMIVAILAIAGSASGYFIYTLRNSAELPPSLEAVTGTGFIAGARDIGFSYEDADATLINSKTGTTTSRSKENEYFYAETDMSFYDVMMNIKADDFDTFKAQVIHYNTEDNLFYLFPGGVFKGLPGTSELRLKDSGDKYAELKNYTIPAFSPFIVFTNSDFKTFDTTAGTGTSKTYQIKSVTQSPSTYDYDVNDRAAGWHLSVLTKAKAVDAGTACPNGVEGVWVYNPEEEDPKKMFGTSPISPSSISSTPSSYLMWINKKVAKNACRVAATQGANTGSGTNQNGSAQGGTGGTDEGTDQGSNVRDGYTPGRFTGTSGNTEQQTQSTTGAQQSAPRVVKVTSSTLNGWYRIGERINIAVHFDKPVTVTSTPLELPSITLRVNDTGKLNTTDTAVYKTGSGTEVLMFEYVVKSLQNTNDLNYASTSALVLNRATIKDANGLSAILTLPPTTSEYSLAGQKNIVIDTKDPTQPTINISYNEDLSEITLTGESEPNARLIGTVTININGEMFSLREELLLTNNQNTYSMVFDEESDRLPDSNLGSTPSHDDVNTIKAFVEVHDLAGNVVLNNTVVPFESNISPSESLVKFLPKKELSVDTCSKEIPEDANFNISIASEIDKADTLLSGLKIPFVLEDGKVSTCIDKSQSIIIKTFVDVNDVDYCIGEEENPNCDYFVNSFATCGKIEDLVQGNYYYLVAKAPDSEKFNLLTEDFFPEYISSIDEPNNSVTFCANKSTVYNINEDLGRMKLSSCINETPVEKCAYEDSNPETPSGSYSLPIQQNTNQTQFVR